MSRANLAMKICPPKNGGSCLHLSTTALGWKMGRACVLLGQMMYIARVKHDWSKRENGETTTESIL